MRKLHHCIGSSSVLSAALLSLAINLVWGLPVIWMVMRGIGAYRWHLFVLIPFMQGLVASLLVSGSKSVAVDHRESHLTGVEEQPGWTLKSLGWRAILASLVPALLSLAGVAAAMIVLRWEGLICLAMASPMVVAACFIGAFVGFFIRRRFSIRSARRICGLVILLMPFVISMDDPQRHSEAPHAVITMIEIDAPPDVVWREVVADRSIPPPQDWYFKIGVGVPQRATMSGRGVGTIRHCRFSTGTAIEPITAWEENRRLAFDVTQSAPPMRELNPFGEVDAPHLHGYLEATAGEFRLIPLPGGRTRLERTTWYRHHLKPEGYWTLWSDVLIERIHRCIMRQIKADAERHRPAISRASAS